MADPAGRTRRREHELKARKVSGALSLAPIIDPLRKTTQAVLFCADSGVWLLTFGRVPDILAWLRVTLKRKGDTQ
jgi:hypothetical protein